MKYTALVILGLMITSTSFANSQPKQQPKVKKCGANSVQYLNQCKTEAGYGNRAIDAVCYDGKKVSVKSTVCIDQAFWSNAAFSACASNCVTYK